MMTDLGTASGSGSGSGGGGYSASSSATSGIGDIGGFSSGGVNLSRGLSPLTLGIIGALLLGALFIFRR
jgi:hypothetical protein